MKTNGQMLAGLPWLLVGAPAQDADDVLDGCHCCRPKSIAVENFSRSLDPLHFLKRLSSARHHAESPLQQTLDKKMME